MRGIKQYSTINASIFLIYLIQVRWIRNLHTSTLAFNIMQLFPPLSHQILPMILNKAGFNTRISQFFSSYLINKQTQYVWNYFTLLSFYVDVSVGQVFTLSPILSALYIALFFYIFEKRTKNFSIPIPISILSFVNDGLFVSYKKSYKKFNMNLYCSYSIISSLFN